MPRSCAANFPQYQILLAANGKEALLLLQTGKPDLVLLDLMMPEMDGFGVLEAMQKMETRLQYSGDRIERPDTCRGRNGPPKPERGGGLTQRRFYSRRNIGCILKTPYRTGKN